MKRICLGSLIAFVLVALVFLSFVPASATLTFDPAPENQPGGRSAPAGCLGLNDPYCDPGGGGGDDDPSFGFGCHGCELLLEDNTDPSSAYYTCASDDLYGYLDCADGSNTSYCTLQNYCG